MHNCSIAKQGWDIAAEFEAGLQCMVSLTDNEINRI